MPSFLNNIRNKNLNNSTLIIVFAAIAQLSLFYTPANSQSSSPSLEPKVKKIVMMLNIVKKEYEAGISKGEIINAAASDTRRKVQVLYETGQPMDHPVVMNFPESEYLRGFILRMQG